MVAGPLREVPTTRGRFLAPPSTCLEAVAALVRHIERAPRGDAYFFYPYSPMLRGRGAMPAEAACDTS